MTTRTFTYTEALQHVHAGHLLAAIPTREPDGTTCTCWMIGTLEPEAEQVAYSDDPLDRALQAVEVARRPATDRPPARADPRLTRGGRRVEKLPIATR
jgi:hypothetical protein